VALHRRPSDPTARPASDAGLTLVEVMVAMVLFVLGSLSLLSVLSSSLSGTFDNRARLTAANLAATDIDEARSLDYFALAPADYTTTVDGRAYRVVREVVVTTGSGSATSACVGSGGVKQFHKRVSTRVTTAFRGATTKAVRADTLVDAPLINPNSGQGAIGFTVLDRTSAPLPGLAVGVPGHSRTTDAPSSTPSRRATTPSP
jgi:Tfp pilus assembly protein PilV